MEFVIHGGGMIARGWDSRRITAELKSLDRTHRVLIEPDRSHTSENCSVLGLTSVMGGYILPANAVDSSVSGGVGAMALGQNPANPSVMRERGETK
jgi:hypothetical protein